MVQVGPLHVERTTNGSLTTHVTIGLIARNAKAIKKLDPFNFLHQMDLTKESE